MAIFVYYGVGYDDHGFQELGTRQEAETFVASLYQRGDPKVRVEVVEGNRLTIVPTEIVKSVKLERK